jgi:hypothetical protein
MRLDTGQRLWTDRHSLGTLETIKGLRVMLPRGRLATVSTHCTACYRLFSCL